MRENPTRLAGVLRVVDTRIDRFDMGNAGVLDPEHGAAVAWHVTDDPERVEHLLRRGADLVQSYGRDAELGPGIYGSAVPGYWIGRARRKWSFLEHLSPGQLRRLVDKLAREVEALRADRYLSSGEYEQAMRDLRYVASGDLSPTILAHLGGQPWNIAFWKPAWLDDIGVAWASPPSVVEMRVVGTLVELDGYPAPATLRALRRVADGAFVRGGFATDPQMVVWNPEAIVSWAPDIEWEQRLQG